jgi:formate C-acetyltransferase
VLTAFLDAGGMIFQGNTTDVEELRRAVENPQDYAHLIVRVGGFSAHFTSLATELQQEIIGRHRHAG